jgi:hypothetical protein
VSFENLVVGAILAAAGLVALPAEADVTKAQCIKANEDGQTLRQAGKIADARVQLRLCGDPTCPAIVRSDCTKRLDELEAIQPTIIFEAKDGAGHDLGAVTVTMDGRPFADKLDGTALDVEPGQHEFTFTVPNQAPVVEKLIIKEADKARHERVVIGAPPPAVVSSTSPPLLASPATPPMPVEPASSGMATRKIAGLIVGGVGVAGFAVGSVFAVLTSSAISAQKTDCPGNGVCPNHAQALSDHSTSTTDGTVSTVGFIAGGALVAGGAVLFLTARHSAAPSPTTGLMVVPSVGPGGGGMLLKGEF